MARRDKIHINLVVIGHVDFGKSTSTGHLIYKCGGIDNFFFEKIEKEVAEFGRSDLKYAWVMETSSGQKDKEVSPSISPFSNLKPQISLHHHRCPRPQRLHQEHDHRYLPS
jgi:elongation factor 1-alpha